jgi:hypothetical protein
LPGATPMFCVWGTMATPLARPSAIRTCAYVTRKASMDRSNCWAFQGTVLDTSAWQPSCGCGEQWPYCHAYHITYCQKTRRNARSIVVPHFERVRHLGISGNRQALFWFWRSSEFDTIAYAQEPSQGEWQIKDGMAYPRASL